MLKKSLTEDAQEVFHAIALIELGTRMQVLESELTLSRDRMIRLYREAFFSLCIGSTLMKPSDELIKNPRMDFQQAHDDRQLRTMIRVNPPICLKRSFCATEPRMGAE